jgi:hypothetical protein
VDLVLPHIHKEYAVCILDLFHMIPSEERAGSNGYVDKQEGMAQVILYDQLVGDDPIAFAIFDPKGLQIVAGDGGKLHCGAIQHEHNTRGNLWED